MPRSHASGRFAALSALALVTLSATILLGAEPTAPAAKPAPTPATTPTPTPATTPPTESKPATPPAAKPAAPTDAAAAALIAQIEKAQGRDAWYAAKAAQFDLTLTFNGRPAFECRVIYDMHTTQARMMFADNTVLVFDGERAWVSPAEKVNRSARFSLRMWPFLLAAPFKLRDPGTHLKVGSEVKLAGKTFTTARLTFDPGSCDTPDDWYQLFIDPQTHRLFAMGYITTYGQKVSDAESNPHAVLFDDFLTEQGVTVPTRWQFHEWSAEKGLGATMGSGEIRNFQFITPPEGSFNRTPTSAEDMTEPRVPR